MIRLLRVELTRLRWRRAILLLLAAAIVVPAIFAVAAAINTKPPSAQERADVAQMVEDERAQPYIQRELKQCLKKPQNYGIQKDDPNLQAQCEQYVLPQPEWFAYYEDLSLIDEREGSGLAVVVIITMIVMLVGTTFAGHDWNSGSMSNQLLFQSRRSRVWAAKALVLVGTSFVLALTVFTLYWLALWSLARSRDLPASNEILIDCLQHGFRGAAVAAGASFAGYALTMLFRSTVATIGVLFAVAIAGGTLIGVLGISQEWQPQVNLAAVIQDGATYYVQVPDTCYGPRPPAAGVCDEDRVLPAKQGALYLGSLIVLAGAASVVSFGRRDVP